MQVVDLERFFVDQVDSDIFGEYKLNPMVFYRWQQEFFEHGGVAFDRTTKKKARWHM